MTGWSPTLRPDAVMVMMSVMGVFLDEEWHGGRLAAVSIINNR